MRLRHASDRFPDAGPWADADGTRTGTIAGSVEIRSENNPGKSFPNSYRLSPLLRRLHRPQHLREPVDVARSIDNRIQQQQTFPRSFVARDVEQRLAKIDVAAKALRAVDQPQIELILEAAHVRDQ